ncbi:hypothetical protein RGR602_PC01643 (plasmid) [Rhizobium gallicum bv. gallicum R602sp]|uniref:Uncharacterized protein n=1 Tax=Rhizobium gallicum bv. gallicum R602sp TaxID=1041138 RepID=A0A0B4XGV0_9HYPH|nr:hypothetical protein RGR602_PC01643 [Rhizobium gallicum bv. gallicum R602sp]
MVVRGTKRASRRKVPRLRSVCLAQLMPSGSIAPTVFRFSASVSRLSRIGSVSIAAGRVLHSG